MERHRERRERPHRDSPDRRRKDEYRSSENSRARRRSRSSSPRRKDRYPEENTNNGGMDQGSDGRQRGHHIEDSRRREDRHKEERVRRRDEGRYREERDRRRDEDRRQEDSERIGYQDRRTRDHRERTSPDPRTDGSRHRKRRRAEREEEDIGQYEFGGGPNNRVAGASDGGDNKEEEKDKPDYGLSGKLTAETNTYKGVVIKYNEPEEARIPKTRWRLYGFKGDETLPTLYVHRQSAYLIGRNRKVVDMPIDHPSCSGQHAVLQYRLVEYDKVDGTTGKKVKPYLIDLESTNGTYINNNRIDPARYYEVKEGDMIKFGFSSREYVLLHEHSKNESVEETKGDDS